MAENTRNTALASLTATYTDSEGESDAHDSDSDNEKVSPRQEFHRDQPRVPDESSDHTFPLVSYKADEDDDMDMSLSYEAEKAESDNSSENATASPLVIEKSGPGSPSPIASSRPQSPVAYHRGLAETGVIVLPPDPAGTCSKTLQDKIAGLYEKAKMGIDMNATIQRRKDFRNPSIYEKLISFCDLDELGTNFPPEVYDPHVWGKESFYEELAKRQKEEVEKREKERKTKVEFISGTAKKAGDEGAKVQQRKTKWDSGPVVTNLPAPGVVSVPTGTKPTVISAFGVLPKKPSKP